MRLTYVIKSALSNIINKNLKGKCILKNQINDSKYLLKKEICQIRVGEMTVEMAYSENNKSFKECILNILKQRAEID